MAVRKNITWKKGKGEAISSSFQYEGCWEEYQVGKMGKRTFGKENQDLKNWSREEY